MYVFIYIHLYSHFNDFIYCSLQNPTSEFVYIHNYNTIMDIHLYYTYSNLTNQIAEFRVYNRSEFPTAKDNGTNHLHSHHYASINCC